MIFRTLREEELDACVAHCCTVFTGASDTVDYFKGHYLNDPYRDPEGVFIAEDDGKIVATVRVFVREVFIKGRRVKMGGIGEVSTQSAYQKRGLSGRLLEMAIDYMQKRGFAVSILFTGTHSHYARYGWFTVNQRMCAPDLHSAPALPVGALLRPVENRDMSTIRGLYGFTASRFDGVVLREHPDYWSEWVTRAWKNPFVLELEKRVVAWADYSYDEQRQTISLCDYATEPDRDWWLPMMAEKMKQFEGSARLWVPSPLMPEYNGAFVEHKGEMVRLITPFEGVDSPGKLAAALADALFWSTDGF